MPVQHPEIASSKSRQRKTRSGLTLVEMLVSVTITLLVVFAIVQIFDIMGQTVAMGRATIEMAGQLRNVTNTLQRDLDNLTCPVEPWVDPDAGVGYFEYVEGPVRIQLNNGQEELSRAIDWSALGNGIASPPGFAMYGDIDDILCMTVRSNGEPFTGRGPGGTTASANVAEVIWWMALYDQNGNNEPDAGDTTVLLRRVLLVLPTLDLSAFTTGVAVQEFFYDYDISARYNSANMVANSLSDLSERKNRFAHQFDVANEPAAPTVPTDFPHEIALFVPTAGPRGSLSSFTFNDGLPHFLFKHERLVSADVDQLPTPTSGSYYLYSSILPRFISQQSIEKYADQIVLNDVVGFDVRAYSPGVLNYYDSGTAITPGDYGYAAPFNSSDIGSWDNIEAAIAVTNPPIFYGAYVDLGFASFHTLPTAPSEIRDSSEFYGEPPEADLQSTILRKFVSYDTWPTVYERDGIDQDTDPGGIIDQGTDGLDVNDAGQFFGGVDDISERETRPPYDIKLPGIEVRIRMLEFSTGQVRQASVVGDFTN